MYFGLKGARTSAEEAYKRQILLFLVVFLLLTVQNVIYYIRQIRPNLYQHTYLVLFGVNFVDYMGMANVVVWGCTGSCLTRWYVYLCVFGTREARLQQADLEMPLLRDSKLHAYNPPSVQVAHAHAQWQQGRDSLARQEWGEGAKRLRQILNDKALLATLKRGQEERVAMALCNALYMQAREALVAGSSSNDSAIKLLQESLSLIKIFEINFPGLIRDVAGSQEKCIVSFPVRGVTDISNH
jgi:hypothetical protein